MRTFSTMSLSYNKGVAIVQGLNARRARVVTITILQSWEFTSCKGPTDAILLNVQARMFVVIFKIKEWHSFLIGLIQYVNVSVETTNWLSKPFSHDVSGSFPGKTFVHFSKAPSA